MKLTYKLKIDDEDKFIQSGFYDAWVEKKTKQITDLAKNKFGKRFIGVTVSLVNKMVNSELTPYAKMKIEVVNTRAKDVANNLSEVVLTAKKE